jgi:uncharacterized membrane protein YbhN (UPF0104 family)
LPKAVGGDNEMAAQLGRGAHGAGRGPAARAAGGAVGSGRAARPQGLTASFALSYLLAFVLLGGLVLAAGFWNVIANTRALAALIAAGIIPLGEDDPGFGAGVPAVNLWIRSQEPVTWQLLLLAAGLFAAVAVLKGVQFHRIAQFLGIEGTFGQHLRAYLYGNGLGRMLPYGVGEVAWASALEGQGNATWNDAAKLVFIFKCFLLFEIATFALVGLVMAGLLGWAASLVPPLLILGGAWLLMRPPADQRAPPGARRQSAREVFAELSREPQTFVGLVILSLVSFLLVEIASYIVPQAFSTLEVPLIQNELRFVVVTPAVVVMAVVGGYVARLVQVTPGGVGQFEWGFAFVLVMAGLPLAPAVVVALLVSAVRYLTGVVVFGITMMTYGIETDLERVLAAFKGLPPPTVNNRRAPLVPSEQVS